MRGDTPTHLDVSLNLRSQLLEVLDDGAVDGPAKIGVLIGDDARLVTDTIVDVLFTRK